MPKGYWVAFYRSVSDQTALANYAKQAGPVIQSHGGRFIARGNPARAYEAAVNLRVAVIEFDSVQAAIDAFESADYQATAQLLQGAAERDIRILEGV